MWRAGGPVADRAPTPGLAELAARLTEPEPAQRPQSAAEALAQLDPATGEPAEPTRPLADTVRGETATVRSARPQAIREGRDIRVRLTLSAAAALAGLALVVILIVVPAQSGSGGSMSASRPARPARSAPLSRQLDYLDQAIDPAHR